MLESSLGQLVITPPRRVVFLSLPCLCVAWGSIISASHRLNDTLAVVCNGPHWVAKRRRSPAFSEESAPKF